MNKNIRLTRYSSLKSAAEAGFESMLDRISAVGIAIPDYSYAKCVEQEV